MEVLFLDEFALVELDGQDLPLVRTVLIVEAFIHFAQAAF